MIDASEKPATSSAPLRGKAIIVTGSNSGIGKETALGLARMGAAIVLGCRDSEKSRSARDEIAAASGNSDIRLFPLDLGDGASIHAFAERCRSQLPGIDVLVNNAAVSPLKRTLTKDGFETTFGVNHLGTFLLTRLLMPLVTESAPSRVVTVASHVHVRARMAWDDLEFEKRRFNVLDAYGASKLANVLFTKALAARLAGSGVTANCLEPGFTKTGLARDASGAMRVLVAILYLFARTPAESARTSIKLASAPELSSTNGAYFDKEKLSSALAMTDEVEAQERLWTLSEAKWGLTAWPRPAS
jgi:NAD(P)-dependent dehydrogenase (short-subunit alcohol dehydrogenase family)